MDSNFSVRVQILWHLHPHSIFFLLKWSKNKYGVRNTPTQLHNEIYFINGVIYFLFAHIMEID